jgi:nucleotide-binding universal stress UspA family protein
VIQNKIKKILVPMDGSKTSFAALDSAIEIARACHATILGVHTISFLPTGFMPAVIPYEIYQKKEAGKFMENAKIRAAKKGIVFKYTITFGSPVEHIINISKSKKFDLIVIGAHGKGLVKELFLGSVSNAILHKSRIPVMIVK